MKHFLLLAFYLTCFSMISVAQESKEKEEKHAKANVPAAVQSAFHTKYPGITKVDWIKEGNNYEANFKENGKEMSAVFGADGSFEEAEVEIKVSELPAGISAWVKAHYNNAAIKEAAKITKANGTVTYEAALKDKDLIFDANGTFIKEEKD